VKARRLKPIHPRREETLIYNQANQLASEATTSTAATYKYGLTGERLEKTVSASNPVIYQYGQAAREFLAENDLKRARRRITFT